MLWVRDCAQDKVLPRCLHFEANYLLIPKGDRTNKLSPKVREKKQDTCIGTSSTLSTTQIRETILKIVSRMWSQTFGLWGETPQHPGFGDFAGPAAVP